MLFHKFVFRSKKKAVKPIAILIVLNLVRNIIFNLLFNLLNMLVTSGSMSYMGYRMMINVLSLVLQWDMYVLVYFMQRNYYREQERVVRQQDDNPQIFTADQEDDNDHIPHPEQDHVFCPGAERESGPVSLRAFRRFRLDEDTAPVIAQSGRESIRAMEHRALDMKHEWNCNDRDASHQPGSPQRVIAPGSGNPIHVAEHSALDIRHEWNCEDQ